MDPRERIRSLSVASPCTAAWSAMRGDDAVRHCATCAQNVFNLEKLTPAQVVELLDSGERVCGRFFRRPDGTVVTRDCAWVWADSKKRAAGMLGGGAWVEIGAVMTVVVVLIAVALLTVTLFGDNLRRLLGSSTSGALTGPPSTSTGSPPAPAPTSSSRLQKFGTP